MLGGRYSYDLEEWHIDQKNRGFCDDEIFDILFSLVAIIILFPFMIPIMIGLKLMGEHDIFMYRCV